MTETDPRLAAAADLVGRTGALTFEIRYADDPQPCVWMAVAGYANGNYEAAAAMDPVRAALRLCEQLIDGGRCVHCDLPTGFEPDDLDTMPADELICWYQWDPELETFRRGCEGSQ